MARSAQHEVRVELNTIPADFLCIFRVGYAGSHGRNAAESLGFDSVFCFINEPFIAKPNKRSIKCGYACSLKQLKSLYAFV